MNYLFLKNIILALTKNFTCPKCKSGIPNDETLDVQDVSQNWVEIAFTCPNCGEKSLLKAEASQMNPQFLQTPIGKKFLNAMKDWKGMMVTHTKKPWIPQEELKKLQEKLQNNITVEDFMNDN